MATVKVLIPTFLQKLTAGNRRLEGAGTDIYELLDNLNTTFPGFKSAVCDKEGNLSQYIFLYINDNDIRFLEGQKTVLENGDNITILPALVGGSPQKEKTMQNPLLFNAFLDSLKIVKSQSLAKITFAIDKTMIDSDTWAQMAQYELDGDVMLSLAVMRQSDVQARAKDIVESSEKETKPDRQKFYLSFIKDNEKFWGFISDAYFAGSVVVEDEATAKREFKNFHKLTSFSELSEYGINWVIREFNDWLNPNKGVVGVDGAVHRYTDWKQDK